MDCNEVERAGCGWRVALESEDYPYEEREGEGEKDDRHHKILMCLKDDSISLIDRICEMQRGLAQATIHPAESQFTSI